MMFVGLKGVPMAKKAKREALILCKDGKRRTQRQIDTKRNGERWLALRYYGDRHEHKAELKLLRRDNQIAVNMIATLRDQLNEALHELAELRKQK